MARQKRNSSNRFRKKKDPYIYFSYKTLLISLLAIAIAGGILLYRNSSSAPYNAPIIASDPATATPLPTFTPAPTGEQKSCPNGFYFFENDNFAICYPNTMSVNEPKHIFNSNGTETDMISFSDKNRYFEVLPVFVSGGGLGRCITKIPVIVDGRSGIRILNNSPYVNGKCARLHQVSTMIPGLAGFYLIETMVAKRSIDLEEYQVVESTLRIKTSL